MSSASVQALPSVERSNPLMCQLLERVTQRFARTPQPRVDRMARETCFGADLLGARQAEIPHVDQQPIKLGEGFEGLPQLFAPLALLQQSLHAVLHRPTGRKLGNVRLAVAGAHRSEERR